MPALSVLGAGYIVSLASNPVGLIWIDAHMDSHAPKLRPAAPCTTCPWRVCWATALPNSQLLGSPAPQSLPQQVCLIGVRNFETAEADLMARLGVRFFTMDEGWAAVLADALRIVQQGTPGFGISIDLGALDPREDPGVGSPVEDCLLGNELLARFKLLSQYPSLLGLELMEYNPHRNLNQVTANMAMNLAGVLLGN